MKTIEIIYWSLWILTIFYLILIIIIPEIPLVILFFLILTLLGFNTNLLYLQKKSLQRIIGRIEKIDLEPLEKEISEIREEQTNYMKRISKIEMVLGELKEELKKLPHDQELKYREIARKVLDLDNKMNEKYRLLGEIILDLKEKWEKKSI